MRVPSLITHRDVAERLHRFGYHDGELPPGDAGLALAIVRAFDRTEYRLGDVPSTSADFDEIRFEHRRICMPPLPAVVDIEAWLQ